MTEDIGDKEAFGYCAGTVYARVDPRATGDPLFWINIPGKPGMFIDCQKSKFGKCHQMFKSMGSTATSYVCNEGENFLVFRANGAHKKGEEMTFINFPN